MKLETFFEKFDNFADAPNGILKMRELLTYFAVSGKLVPNDPSEDPVGLALSSPALDDGALPSNWRSGLLGEAFTFEYGDNLPAPKRSETGEYPVYGSNGIVGTHDKYLTKDPAIIIGRKGSAGALNIANGPSWTTDVAYFVHPPKDLDLKFTYYLFSTLHLDELGKGIKPGLNRKEAYALRISLPPLAEQKRIVAKVDELIVACDQLKAQQQEREMRHIGLARAALARFSDAPTPANLSLLFHPSYPIAAADLRKSILDLAVQGKLVPQDPNDEPASSLLEKIAAKRSEPRRFVRARANGNWWVGSEESSRAIPDGWGKASLAELVTVLNGRAYSKDELLAEGTPVLRVGNLFTSNRWYYSNLELESDKYCDNGDLIFAWSASFGPFIWPGPKVIYHYHIWKLEPHSEAHLNKRYLYWFLQHKTREIKEAGHGVSMVHMTKEKMEKLAVLIPPLAEQGRIVEKVNQLITLVGDLETQLANSRKAGDNLLQAVVNELTAKG